MIMTSIMSLTMMTAMITTRTMVMMTMMMFIVHDPFNCLIFCRLYTAISKISIY